MQLTSNGVALAVHGLAAPVVFAALAVHYFRPRGAREPLATAIAMTAIVVALDAIVVAGLVYRSPAMFASIAGTWLPFALIFAATWVAGFVVSTMPWPTSRACARGSLTVPRRIVIALALFVAITAVGLA